MPKKERKITRLFNEIQSGSKIAFDELFNAYFGRLVAFANQYTKQIESAEEITSDLFVKLWTKRDTLHTVLNPEVYLYVAVKNACLNFIRSDKKRTRLFTEELNDFRREQITECYDVGEEKELKRLLAIAVAAMPLQQKIIFKLIKEDGLKTNAVAQILGLSKRTVENHLYKGLKTLADSISAYLGYHPQSRLVKKKIVHVLFNLFFM